MIEKVILIFQDNSSMPIRLVSQKYFARKFNKTKFICIYIMFSINNRISKQDISNVYIFH